MWNERIRWRSESYVLTLSDGSIDQLRSCLSILENDSVSDSKILTTGTNQPASLTHGLFLTCLSESNIIADSSEVEHLTADQEVVGSHFSQYVSLD